MLLWVSQFIQIINERIQSIPKDKLFVNDIGCNVGHFYRGIDNILLPVDYIGYDISDTYLSIAKDKFEGASFCNLDISKTTLPRIADVSVISATLEHISDFSAAIRNIFDTTKELVVLRTFVGDQYICEYCLTHGANSEYPIQQFSIDDLNHYPASTGWIMESVCDQATRGKSKYVCNNRTILRTQRIFVFTRK